MKKFFTSIFLFTFILSFTVYSQNNSKTDLDPTVKNKNIFDVISADNNIINSGQNINPPFFDQSSINVLPSDNSTSQNGRAPMGGRRYIRTVYLIKPSEMVTSGFGSDLVTSIGWTYLTLNVQFPQNVATGCDSLVVYLMNTADVTNTRGPLGWAAAITGMTKVYKGQCAIPSGLGPHSVDVNMGGAGTSPFSTIAGQGVYIAFEYTNAAGTIALTTAAPNIDCNSLGLVSGAYTGQSQLAHTNTLTASSFRAATRFGGSTKSPYIDIASVSTLSASGKAALCVCPDSNKLTYAIDHLRNVPDIITAKVRVINVLGGTVKQEWTDFINSNTISTNYITHAWMKDGDTKKYDSIVIEVLPGPGENVLYNNKTNHRNAYVKQTTLNSWNYSIPTDTVDGGFGVTGNFPARTAVCFHTNCNLHLCAVDLIFNRFDLLNNKPYHVEVYGDAAGSPGPVIYTSPQYRVPFTNLGQVPVSHSLSLTVPAGNYYVAAVQDSLINFGLGFQWEAPMRTGTFFFKNTTATVWTDAGAAAAGGTFIFRPSLGVRTTLNLNLGAYLEGFYDGNTMIPDTVRLIAHKLQGPAYVGLDTAASVLDAGGIGNFEFCNLNNDSCYIYEVRHRNHIATWAKLNCEKIDQCGKQYNFRFNINQAYGGNMVFIAPPNGPALNEGGGGYSFYTADVNQDNCVDISDCGDIDNDAFNFVSGYVVTDVNGDSVVDLIDLAYCDNNSGQFICVAKP